MKITSHLAEVETINTKANTQMNTSQRIMKSNGLVNHHLNKQNPSNSELSQRMCSLKSNKRDKATTKTTICQLVSFKIIITLKIRYLWLQSNNNSLSHFKMIELISTLSNQFSKEQEEEAVEKTWVVNRSYH